MSLDEDLLGTAANGGSIDLEKWASMVAPLLERLDYIVYNAFPMPQVPSESHDQQSFPSLPSQQSETNTIPPESSNKENSSPNQTQTAPTGSPPSSERVPDSQPQASADKRSDTLPPPLALLLNSIRSSINSLFTEKPPHTIQRLAELVLRPTAHYRTLPAYLRAVDRVVSVTSGADIFPFQTPSGPETSLNGPLHSNPGGTYLGPDYSHGLGSDESLGGALLTPIPWLTNVSFEAEDSAALEEASEEILSAQPQDVDVGTTASATMMTVETEHPAAATASPPAESSEEFPHARGPPVVGVADMGLQDGKGVEMPLEQDGQQPSQSDNASDTKSSAPGAAMTGEPATKEGSATTDQDGDIVLEDTKAKETAESKTAVESSDGASDSVQPSATEKKE
ncbi:hypothetical protein NUU61_008005 [Penicillium alfredii]|uniref:Protein phosphatase 4 core regulatory subunit R2 n=1 Tax=Penicillium alfredii TaxID=1506179 RepID=A0A9W9JYV2_9EURO|nr:uncharacterized protein NUU61_008005 [Penicillium alfredii]KAJ5086698.1 hypothetical protein NUU61_008005 [Penicillium alfredii]